MKAICQLRLELAAVAIATALSSGAAANAAPEDTLEVDCKIVAISNSAMRQLEDEHLAGMIYHLSAINPRANLAADAPSSAIFGPQVNAPADQDKLMRRLSEIKGVDLLSAPRVETQVGTQAKIEIGNEVSYPTEILHHRARGAAKPTATASKFAKANPGLSVEINSRHSYIKNAVDLGLKWDLSEFQGPVIDLNAPPGTAFRSRPVLSTQSVETSVTMESGATLVLGTARFTPEMWRELKTGGSLNETGAVINFITVRRVPLAASRAPAPAQKSPAS
jgi:type II secretory pathway component GspD/PulD (secretin)